MSQGLNDCAIVVGGITRIGKIDRLEYKRINIRNRIFENNLINQYKINLDGRKNNGGHSTKGKAGRKPKAEEERLRDMLSPYRTETIIKVVNIMRTGEKESDQLAAAKLLMSYDWGLPKQHVDHTTGGDTINIISLGKGIKPDEPTD
tara:strand:- start:74 stop:514 length:441 start_codon:yes stop_codon:yes gene_type:complete